MDSNCKYTILYTHSAEQDIDNLFTYIKEKLGSVKAAEKQVINIYTAVMKLETFPKCCEVLSFKKFRERGYRRLIVDNYLIFYTVDEKSKKVILMRVLYGKQKYEDIL